MLSIDVVTPKHKSCQACLHSRIENEPISLQWFAAGNNFPVKIFVLRQNGG
jgi:hypothetical protein